MSRDFLVDTHSFPRWTLKDPSLPPRVKSLLEDKRNTIFLSAVTCWEIQIKFQLAKLDMPLELALDVAAAAKLGGFSLLPIAFGHAQQIGLLPRFKNHKNPFDRMLIAQSIVERMTLISKEEIFGQYGVTRVW